MIWGEILSLSFWNLLGKLMLGVCIILLLIIGAQHLKIKHQEGYIEKLTNELNQAREDASFLLQGKESLEEQYLQMEKHYTKMRSLCKKMLEKGEDFDETRIKNLFKDLPD